MTTTAELTVDRAAILCEVLREIGYRQFGPNGDCAVFAHRDLPVVIVPLDDSVLTEERLQSILLKIDMSETEWREVSSRRQFS